MASQRRTISSRAKRDSDSSSEFIQLLANAVVRRLKLKTSSASGNPEILKDSDMHQSHAVVKVQITTQGSD